MINRAFCFAKIGNFKEAIEDYTKVLEKDKDNTHVLYNRAISLDKMGRSEEAILDFTRIIELEPMNANAYLNRGCCYEKIKNSDLAYKDYEASLLIDKKLGKEMEESKKYNTSK
jgi:tetratricopeptide (TPR) repeat protein